MGTRDLFTSQEIILKAGSLIESVFSGLGRHPRGSRPVRERRPDYRSLGGGPRFSSLRKHVRREKMGPSLPDAPKRTRELGETPSGWTTPTVLVNCWQRRGYRNRKEQKKKRRTRERPTGENLRAAESLTFQCSQVRSDSRTRLHFIVR